MPCSGRHRSSMARRIPFHGLRSARLLGTKRLAEDDESNEIAQTVALLAQIARDLINVRPVQGFYVAAHAIGEQFFSECSGK